MIDPVTLVFAVYAQERSAKVAEFSMRYRDEGAVSIARALQERAAYWHAQACKTMRGDYIPAD